MSIVKIVSIAVGIALAIVLFNVIPDGALADRLQSALLSDGGTDVVDGESVEDGKFFSESKSDDQEAYKKLASQNMLKNKAETSADNSKEHRWGQ